MDRPMARVIVETNDGERVGVIEIDGNHGPWTDGWQGGIENEFAQLVSQAVRAEGGG